jgi:lipooligosaccharide transport system ATP-binding protein
MDLDLRAGECLALLGPVGAGKSTAVRMLSGRIACSTGTVEIAGLPLARHPRRARRQMGVVPQGDDLDDEFGVLQNLLVHGSYFGLGRRECRRRAAELMRFLDLEGWRAARIRDLSLGMKRRLQLARALIQAPAILLLDEPTAGVAPADRETIRDRIRALVRSGTAVLLATGDAEEAARLASLVAILDHGKILDVGAPSDLVSRHCPGAVVELVACPAEVLALVGEAGHPHEAIGRRLLVHPPEGREESLIRDLGARLGAGEATLRRGTLGDVFFRLTGRELGD